ncbi:amidohydrolase, partial [Enterococcus faecalis]
MEFFCKKTLIKNVHILTMYEQFSEIKVGKLLIEEDTNVELAPMTKLGETQMTGNQ